MAKRESFKVAKQGLDPFGAKKQAVDLVRRRRAIATGPNTTDINYEVQERGNHFEVTVESSSRGTHLPSVSRGRGKAKGRAKNADRGKRKGQDKGKRKGQNKPKQNNGKPESDKFLSVNDSPSSIIRADGPDTGGLQVGPETLDIDGQLTATYNKSELRD